MTDKAVVLIVDDAPANIQVLAACLKDKYHVKVAADGERCLELACAEPAPDLILLDIDMPGMNGYEVCRHLKSDARTSAIPVIFVTGMDEEADEENGLRLGAVDYIVKPVRPAIVAVRVATHVMLKQQRDKLTEMALKDQLTGLYNRHYLQEVADQKMARAGRHNDALCLLVMDIDHFKSINDGHGHPVGDAVLQQVAGMLIEQNRKEDVVARLGGEEFVVLLDQCNCQSAMEKAESIRKEVEALEPEGITVTVSIGLAAVRPGEFDFDDLLKRADDAMYRAKNAGRNRVMSGDSTGVGC